MCLESTTLVIERIQRIGTIDDRVLFDPLDSFPISGAVVRGLPHPLDRISMAVDRAKTQLGSGRGEGLIEVHPAVQKAWMTRGCCRVEPMRVMVPV
jgi:hypothetical protein